MKKIAFIPELELDADQVPVDVSVKGRRPSLAYTFSLADIYPLLSSFNPAQAYQKIAGEFERLDVLLYDQLKLRNHFLLPHAVNDFQALSLLGILFDPSYYHTDGLWKKLIAPTSGSRTLFEVSEARPYPLRLAAPQKLIHTLAWIDTNIKVSVENLLISYQVAPSAIHQIVESALKIYTYLIKQQDFRLARSISFNYSMFLQDRILNLILGDNIYLVANQLQVRGRLANHIALQLLKNLTPRSYRQLCTLSVFMGCIWTHQDVFQRDYLTNPEAALVQIDSQLNANQPQWGIDHADHFLEDIGHNDPATVVVILDDNGESVFDIALFQQLLKDNGSLKIVFIVNRYPISENIDLAAFHSLIEDAYFADLKSYLEQGRIALHIENQVFRSFELAYLQPQAYRAMQQSKFVYIKGANFFETFQPDEMTRYYCFTVYSPTSMVLTGCSKGNGIFAKLLPGQTGYTYHSYDRIETLRDKVAERVIKED